MKAYLAACAWMVAVLAPAAALADDPKDPAMRSAAARERDRIATRALNRQQMAYVQQRDSAYAQNWSPGQGAQDNALTRSSAAAYEQSRRDYEQDLAAWRYATAQCRAGNYAYCAR